MIKVRRGKDGDTVSEPRVKLGKKAAKRSGKSSQAQDWPLVGNQTKEAFVAGGTHEAK